MILVYSKVQSFHSSTVSQHLKYRLAVCDIFDKQNVNFRLPSSKVVVIFVVHH